MDPILLAAVVFLVVAGGIGLLVFAMRGSETSKAAERPAMVPTRQKSETPPTEDTAGSSRPQHTQQQQQQQSNAGPC